ncbi:response regulator [Desulfopila sp. IMCC35008]|uniref:response regulator n=1 Tax=Desulfopila sp. IMCC35008 TaxID=2653858 RepID=UPI0013D55B22|nr:response regulator [Desulfopila sp. IMCC35008]
MEKAHYLVIDDDECIRIFLVAVFQNEAGVTTACGGREALNLLDQHQYDVIMSDVRMPYLIGLDFFQAIRTVTSEVAGKFILCTGNVIEEVTSFCSEHHI